MTHREWRGGRVVQREDQRTGPRSSGERARDDGQRSLLSSNHAGSAPLVKNYFRERHVQYAARCERHRSAERESCSLHFNLYTFRFPSTFVDVECGVSTPDEFLRQFSRTIDTPSGGKSRKNHTSFQINPHAAQPSQHVLDFIQRTLGDQYQELISAKPN